MDAQVISKLLFTVTFPPSANHRPHVSALKLHLLARKQLPDLEVIETIEHLFKCQRCFECYRLIRTSYLQTV